MSKLHCSLFLVAFLLVNAFASSNADKRIGIYELKRGNFSVKLTNFGATVLSFVIPDKHGKLSDIVLGFEDLQQYIVNDTTYFGALVGRVANRIGGAKFFLNGVEYKLFANDGNNTLHGGLIGFSKVLWTTKSYKKDSHVTFTYDSFDGEEGFPGALTVEVTYLIIGTNKWGVKMLAWPHNKATPVNLAQHTYWNLGGHDSGDILSHKIQLYASEITPVDPHLIPTGQFASVKGTPYDFLQPYEIGSRINEVWPGYDMNYVIDRDGKSFLNKVATVEDGVSGRKMELWTNQPGVQFYTGNFLQDVKGKGGVLYEDHDAFCLETQGFPDSVNHPDFPSQIVNPGERYQHVMVHRFTAN